MQNSKSLISMLAVAGILAGSIVTASPVKALSVSSQKVGRWVVTDVFKTSGIEAYKVDRQLVAWTVRSGNYRTIYAFDGVSVRLLATIPVSDWNETDADKDFFDPISGNFDVADGLVVWTQHDGHDREIYAFNGESTVRVSDNSYDDRHPITSEGSVAWTSQPGDHYNLVIKQNGAFSKVDTYQVMNYAFSGKNLFWMNRRGNEAFKVFRFDGSTVNAIGVADDRPIRAYFSTDGNGSAAWEVSTKQWNQDRRVMYNSYNGETARQIIVRMVPPFATTLEDVDGGEIVLNSFDYNYQKLESRVSLIRSNGATERNVASKSALAKARYMDGGVIIRHVEPENGSMLMYVNGLQDFVSLDPIMHNMFDADGPTTAAAIVNGGMLLWNEGKSVRVPTVAKVTDLKVVNGDVAWTETDANGVKTLRFASRGVMVRTSTGPALMGGHLVKASGNRAVYFAAEDGKRYVFSGENQFRTWYGNFSSMRTVSVSALSAKPLGGPVIYKPGSRLVKAATSPRIYMIGEDGQLHWINNLGLLESMFGTNWNQKLDLLNETLFADYIVGKTVSSGSEYHAALTK